MAPVLRKNRLEGNGEHGRVCCMDYLPEQSSRLPALGCPHFHGKPKALLKEGVRGGLLGMW